MMGNYLKDFPLPVRQVMRHPLGRDVAAGQKAHPDTSGLFAELGLGMTGLDAQFHNLLRAAPPSLDHAAQVKHIGNQWVARPGRMFALEVFRRM